MEEGQYIVDVSEIKDTLQTYDLFLGDMIKQELKAQERTVAWLARKLNCDRTNIYDIFKRRTIDTELLMRISIVMKCNFFERLSKIADEKIEENSTKPSSNVKI